MPQPIESVFFLNALCTYDIHLDECITCRRGESTVQWQTLQHSNSIFQHQILVVQWLSRSQTCETLSECVRCLHIHVCKIVHDRGLLLRPVDLFV